MLITTNFLTYVFLFMEFLRFNKRLSDFIITNLKVGTISAKRLYLSEGHLAVILRNLLIIPYAVLCSRFNEGLVSNFGDSLRASDVNYGSILE